MSDFNMTGNLSKRAARRRRYPAVPIAMRPLAAALDSAEGMPITISALLQRTVTTDAVIAVEYAITPLGRTLGPLFQALDSWTQDHLAEVEAARRRYDGLTD